MEVAAEIILEERPRPAAPAHPSRLGPEGPPPVTVIERRPGLQVVDLAELWRYRELLVFLVWRDVMVRYKQTALGVAWAVLQPLATMLVFSLFFGRMAASRAIEAPYPLFVFAGLLPWIFLSNAVGAAGQSLVGNQNLVTKAYFPRILIPAGAAAAGLVDLAISFGMLAILMLYYGAVPGWGLLMVPLLVVGLMIVALGIGTLLAALTVAYRDFRHIVPFLLQLWLFATPAIYMQAEHGVGPRWRALLPLNPAYGLIANFRQAILGGPLDLESLAVSGAVGLVALLVGCLYFRTVERGFADVI